MENSTILSIDVISGQDNKIAERTQFEITGQQVTSPNNKMQVTLKKCKYKLARFSKTDDILHAFKMKQIIPLCSSKH